MYENTSNYLLRLVRERKFQIEKRCYIVQLPYCKSDDIPEETKHLKRLSLPKELPKLVKIIHATERVKCASSVSDRKFLDSVKLAKLETLEEDVNSVKDGQETGQLDLLFNCLLNLNMISYIDFIYSYFRKSSRNYRNIK